LKTNKYMMTGLFIAVVFALYMLFFTGGNKKISPVMISFEPPRLMASTVDVRARESRSQTVRQSVRWDRDPFLLPVVAAAEKNVEEQRAPLRLFAIMEGGRGRLAIIDNQVVANGDLISGERVVDVGKESVTLVQNGSKRIIRLQASR
jgi:hypothetical protein